MPNKPGSARGFLNKVCVQAPAHANKAPHPAQANALGNLNCQKIYSKLGSPEINFLTNVRSLMFDEPEKRERLKLTKKNIHKNLLFLYLI